LSISSKPLLLLVDDDLSILKVFAKIFLRKGFSVKVAETGNQAIEQLKTSSFDVALIDFCLPDMEGSTLFQLITESSPKTIKIMVTGKIQLENQIQGADAFIGKPVDPQKLLSLIDTKLKHRNMES
jgi:DNA-binding NtrC family response regulator